jgi:uncharacterized membrane protein
MPEEPHPDDEELTELLDQLEDAEETVDTSNQRHAIRRTRRLLSHFPNVRRFGFDDIAQQIVGGFILSAPFVVTEEVWTLAASMNLLQTAITIFMVFAIGYGTLYRAEDREAEMERSIAGIPLRFISLLIVSYTSVTILAFVFDAPDAFSATWFTTFKAICIGAIFSVVGAATADSLF